jgi:hypothetical protein
MMGKLAYWARVYDSHPQNTNTQMQMAPLCRRICYHINMCFSIATTSLLNHFSPSYYGPANFNIIKLLSMLSFYTNKI